MKSNNSQICKGKEDISPPSVLSFIVICYVSSLLLEECLVLVKINY